MNEHFKSLLEVFSKIPTREEFTKAFKAAIANKFEQLVEKTKTIDSRPMKVIKKP